MFSNLPKLRYLPKIVIILEIPHSPYLQVYQNQSQNKIIPSKTYFPYFSIVTENQKLFKKTKDKIKTKWNCWPGENEYIYIHYIVMHVLWENCNLFINWYNLRIWLTPLVRLKIAKTFTYVSYYFITQTPYFLLKLWFCIVKALKMTWIRRCLSWWLIAFVIFFPSKSVLHLI